MIAAPSCQSTGGLDLLVVAPIDRGRPAKIEGDAIERVQHSLVEALGDAIRLRAIKYQLSTGTIRAETKPRVEDRGKAFIWPLQCLAGADSLAESGVKLFTLTRFPTSQWKAIRASNAIERPD